jgi:hypothetical protein
VRPEIPKVDRPHNKDLDPFCEDGVMQLGSEIDVPWQLNRENRKFKLVSQFELDVDFASTLCKKSPTLSVQIIESVLAAQNEEGDVVPDGSVTDESGHDGRTDRFGRARSDRGT